MRAYSLLILSPQSNHDEPRLADSNHALAEHLCTKIDITSCFGHFCGLLEIKTDWNKAQRLIERSKNIFIALICGYIREMERNILYEIPSFVIWWIYVYFPRWSLMTISKFVELHKYQLNQHIQVPNRLPTDDDDKVLGLQLKPTKRMKPFQRNLRDNIDDTIFESIDMNHDDIYLDYRLLEELWAKQSVPMYRARINYNTFAVFDDEQREYLIDSYPLFCSRIIQWD